MRTQCCGQAWNAFTTRCPDCPFTVRPPGYQGYLTAPVQPQTGWICPRCNVVNAPSVQQCLCNSLQGAQLNGRLPNEPADIVEPTKEKP